MMTDTRDAHETTSSAVAHSLPTGLSRSELCSHHRAAMSALQTLRASGADATQCAEQEAYVLSLAALLRSDKPSLSGATNLTIEPTKAIDAALERVRLATVRVANAQTAGNDHVELNAALDNARDARNEYRRVLFASDKSAIDIAIDRLMTAYTPAEQGLLGALITYRDCSNQKGRAIAAEYIRGQGHGHLLPIGELSELDEAALTSR